MIDMLVLQVPLGDELYDEERGVFSKPKTVERRCEHSLFTVSKWEEKWHIPFFVDNDKTEEQLTDYIRCMLIDETQEPYLVHLRSEDIIAINEYISDPATATTVHTFGPTQSRGRQIVTSEVLYFQMFSRQIPIECQHWHINRFMMLLRVWDAYNADPKTGKMSRKQTAAMYARENARRQRLMHSKG